jgi:hypothetical protein
MKKIIIGSIVGGILLFAWLSLSWMVFGFHDKAYRYTPAQDSLVNIISADLQEEGQYVMPNVPPNALHKEMEDMMSKNDGKPWVVINYHKAHSYDMVMPMIRGFLICLVSVWLCCLVIARLDKKSFNRILAAALIFGAICFLYKSYMGHNWMDTSWDILTGELIDDIAGWGLAGTWLGWWYSRE